MASLKERMALFNKASKKSDADDHKEFKKKSGNTEQPDKVGKLNHSYLSRDSAKGTKRNFKITFKKKKEEEEKAKPSAEEDTKPEDSKPTAAAASASESTPKPAPAAKSKPNRMQSARISMAGMLKNPFLASDTKGKAKVEKQQAETKEAKEKALLDEAAKAEEEAEAAEAEDQFVIPEGDEDAEEEEDGDEAQEAEDKPKRGALRSFVQQSQRLSLGIFARKKLKPTARANSDVMDSKAREKAGIRLHQGANKPPPRKRLSLLGRMGSSRRAGGGNNNKVNAQNLVLDRARAPEVEELLNEISKFNPKAFSLQKRLSIRDNDIVQAIQRVIGNDPKQISIVIDTDVRFNHLRSSMIQDFGDSIRKNLYLKTLTIRGVELGNTFLEALASAIRDNVTLQEIDLSRNSFTHDALVEFCQALEHNHTITTVRLQTQLSPVYEKSVETVLEAIEKNRSVKTMSIDFQGDIGNKYDKRLKEITQRNYWNKDNVKMPNPDDLLVDFLKEEVVRAEELHKQQELEKDLEEVREGDWDYLYELSVLFDRFKLDGDESSRRENAVQNFASPMHAAQSRNSNGFGTGGKNPLTGAQGFPSDGSFLTEEFIDAYLQEDPEKGGLVFNFCNQVRLFKQFPSTSPDRETIVNIFVYELLNHPRQQEFTGINMTNTGCGDDFWMKLSEGVLEDPDMLPNINMISAETNFLTEPGIVAIANMIRSDTSLRYLQIVKLDNQKALLSSKAERALARAMCQNLSIIRFSLRVRNLLERDQCNKYVLRNIDFLRQARRHHKINTGTLKERKRNAMEQLFDSIAANDPSITEVEISADIKFTGLSDVEKVKCAKAFATNSHVTKVTMNQLQLGDKFAVALGESLEKNDTIEKLIIEGNAFTGAGFKGIFAGLGKNSSVLELLAKHQTKAMSSPDEQALPGLLEGNTTITKISLDLRNSAVTMQLDKICNQNRANKMRAEGTSERKRNAMEQFFDKIAEDDETITEVELSADVKFTGLSNFEKIKSAKAFATNTHVTKVTMNQLQLGDDFLIALGEALETNNTIERLVIEGNSFTGPGFKRLFEGLGKNTSVRELLGAHQTKSMSSSDEQALPAFIEENTTVSKISLDLRNSAVTMALDKICNRNSQARRRQKNSSATAEMAGANAAAAVASTPAHLRDSTAAVPVELNADEKEVPEESEEPVAEEKPFDEDVPDDEKTSAAVKSADEAPAAEAAGEPKAVPNENPFDEDQPFDEGPEDEVGPADEVPMDEAPAGESREVPVDEDAPADELNEASEPVEETAEEAEPTPAPEVSAEETPAVETPTEETPAEPESSPEEAPATPQDTQAEETEPEQEPDIPAIVQAGNGDEVEITLSQEEATPEDTPAEEETEPEAAEPESSPEEAPTTPEDTVIEENEPARETPAIVEAGEGDEIEVSAAPEAETAQQEEAPAAVEDATPEAEAEEDSTPEEFPAEQETEPEAPAEEPAPTPEEPPAEQQAEAEAPAQAEEEAEETEAPATEEPASNPEETPAEEAEPQAEAPAEGEEEAGAAAASEGDSAPEEEATAAEQKSSTPEEAPAEENEAEPAPEEESSPEEEATPVAEEPPAEDKEPEAEAPAVVEAAEEVEAAPEEDAAAEVENEPKPDEIEPKAEETPVEEIDGKSAESWDTNPDLNVEEE